MPHDDRDKMDEQIAPYVEILIEGGIETYESCQGGAGHSYPEPTIRFHGDRSEGFRALAIAIQRRWPVQAVKRCWDLEDGEPTGPTWEMVFYLGQPPVPADVVEHIEETRKLREALEDQ